MSEAQAEVQDKDAAASGGVRPAPRRSRRPAGTKPVIADHEILSLIGTGAYGEVWLARTVTGAHRAVKVVWREDFEDERSFIRECEGILQYEPIAVIIKPSYILRGAPCPFSLPKLPTSPA